jgi:hypothetical protein
MAILPLVRSSLGMLQLFTMLICSSCNCRRPGVVSTCQPGRLQASWSRGPPAYQELLYTSNYTMHHHSFRYAKKESVKRLLRCVTTSRSSSESEIEPLSAACPELSTELTYIRQYISIAGKRGKLRHPAGVNDRSRCSPEAHATSTRRGGKQLVA